MVLTPKMMRKMKNKMRYFSMAVLFVAATTLMGCEKEEPAYNGDGVHYTTTVKMAGGNSKHLDAGGHKTFAEGEQIAVIYKNTNGTTVKAVSAALTSSDIHNSGKVADFSVELENPDKTQNVTYIYPAAMANDDGTMASIASQDGTLASLSSDLDYCTYTGAWSAGNLPTNQTLTNQLAVCKFTVKNFGVTDITSSITSFTINDGSHTYTITRSVAADTIYVALLPVSNAAISFAATSNNGTTFECKVTGKTLAANKMYPIILSMAAPFSVSSTKKVLFSHGNLRATTTDLGAHWTWSFATNQWDKVGGKDQSGSGAQTGNNYINGNGTVSSNGTVDLFGWSTSATHLGIHNSTNNSDYSGDFVDWGSAAEVTATIGTGWRTLSNTIAGGAVGEWDYLLTRRTTTSSMRFYKAQVNGVNGLIVFPDNWNNSYHSLNASYVNNNTISFENTKITASVWNTDFEAHGAVFLPVAGQRHVDNNYVEYPNGRGHYWSSTPNNAGTAYRLYFSGSSSEWSYSIGSSRRFGYAVRLVRDAN